MDYPHLSRTAITHLVLTEHKDTNEAKVSSAESGRRMHLAARAPVFPALTPKESAQNATIQYQAFLKKEKSSILAKRMDAFG